MLSRNRLILALISAAALATLAPAVRADQNVLGGARVGYFADPDAPLVGGEVLVKVVPAFYFNPNVEFVLQGDSYITANADFHYDFPINGSRTTLWAGAGLGVISVNPDGPAPGDTEAGLNVLLGAGMTRGDVIPYFQAKVIAKDDSELSLAFGLRF
ncbi:MAG TPA: hypothetical protein VFM88_08450 [Vicinamibacteria bacterium]|nr:hypothetical protein [Vicinamibacteria bacterium]